MTGRPSQAGAGRRSTQGLQTKALQRRPSKGGHERQAEQRAQSFVHGASGLGRGLSPAPAAAYHDTASVAMPLPQPLLGRLQQAFDADLAAIRVHTAASVASVDFGAHAFASGAELYFAPGAWAPDSRAGQELIAHEVTHALQQAGRRGADGRWQVRPLHGSGDVQCAPDDAAQANAEAQQKRNFEQLVMLHRGSAGPGMDVDLNDAVTRAGTLLGQRLVADHSRPAFAEAFRKVAETREFRQLKSPRARSFILDALKLLGHFKAAASMLADDGRFELRTLGLPKAFLDFLRDDADFGRAWIGRWLAQGSYARVWPAALLRNWRAFYLRPTWVAPMDNALAARLRTVVADEQAQKGQSPPQLKGDHYWLAWTELKVLDDERIVEQSKLRGELLKFSTERSLYETLGDELPRWRTAAATAAEDAARSAPERTLAAGKIPLIDEAIAYWKMAFAAYHAWVSRASGNSDAALLDPASLSLPDGSLVAAAAKGLREPLMTAARALFRVALDAEGHELMPLPDAYAQGLATMRTALVGTAFAVGKKGPSLTWADHFTALALGEATVEKPDPQRQAQFAILPLLVNDLAAQLDDYDVAADQAAPHFDDIRRAHRIRLARRLALFARWLGWSEIVDVVGDTLAGIDGGAYTGKARLMLIDDWSVDERQPIATMLHDFPGNLDRPILVDTPFTVRHVVEWFRYDYHRRLREALARLVSIEAHLDTESKLDFNSLHRVRHTQKEVRNAMAASAEAEHAISSPGDAAIKVPQRFSVKRWELLKPKGAEVVWDDLIADHPKTWLQLERRNPRLIFPQEPMQGVFTWMLPPLDGMFKLLATIPSLATMVARHSGEGDAAWLSRLSPYKRGQDDSISAKEAAKVRLSDTDWAELNRVLLMWLQRLGSSQETEIPGLWRRAIVLRRRQLAMTLAPRIAHFAEHPYISHGPWGETDEAMKVRLDTPEAVLNGLRRFEGWARPMREVGSVPKDPAARAEFERQEREAASRAADVQLVLLLLTMSPALLKLRASALDGYFKRGLYEYFTLVIGYLEDDALLQSLRAGLEVHDEAAAQVISAERRAKILAGLREFIAAIDEEAQEAQNQGGFRSEDGRSIRPNAARVTHAILASKTPFGADPAGHEFRADMRLAPGGGFLPDTGTTYRLVDVYTVFRFHRQVGALPPKSMRKGAGGPYAPARVIVTRNGETTEYAAPDLPDIPLFKIRIDEREFEVKASDVDMLTELDEIFLWRSFQLGMDELSEGIHSFVDWMQTIATIFVPEAAMAEFVVGMAQMLASGEFDDLVQQLKDDPLAFAQHAVDQLSTQLFQADHIWSYLLLGGQHSPWGALADHKSARQRKVNPPRSTKLGRVVAALRTLGRRFSHGLERFRDYTQPPLRRVQGRIAMHPTLLWVLHRAVEIVGAAYDLIPRDQLEAARKGDGPVHLVELAQVAMGEQGGIEGEMRDRMVELFDGIQRFELPGELIELRAATELIIGFILDRFGKRGKILRMLLSAMPVPESWTGSGQGKGFTNALSFLSARIEQTWLRGSALDPNQYWKKDLMPIIGTKFGEVRDDLVTGLYAATNDTLGNMGLAALAPPAASALPKTEVAPESLLGEEGEASIPDGARRLGRPQLPGGTGQALPSAVRAPYERQLGADLSHVRVHTAASGATAPIGADALTSGSHVYLRPGVELPSSRGQSLLAHELTHVVQQTGPRGATAGGTRQPTRGRPGLGLRVDAQREAAADSVAGHIGRSQPVPRALRRRIGSASGLQPSLGKDVALEVIAELSKPGQAEAFTKHLEGGRDPQGWAEAKALAEGVFAMLKSGTGVEYATFMHEDRVRKKVREYVRELSDRFPPLELKRIASLAQKPHRKKTADGPDTELDPRGFLQLLANYVFASRHVAMKITPNLAVTRAQKVELFNLNMAGIGGTSDLWKWAMEASFQGSTVVTAAELPKAQAEMRERLRSLGPQPNVWESRHFRFADWLVKDYVELLTQRAQGGVTSVPPVSEYAQPRQSGVVGLAVATHGELKRRGVGTFARESHHTTQYLLVEYFGNDPEATQKAFPGDTADFAGAGIEFRQGSSEVERITGSGASPLGVAVMNQGSERGAGMPAVLLSARCHQRGELHVLRESRWSDPTGEKERKGTPTQGYAIENQFNAAIKPASLRPRDESAEHRKQLRAAIAADPTAARTAYHGAALATYRWMRSRMLPALQRGLLTEEMAYYRGIAAKSQLQADGESLAPLYNMKPGHLNAVHEAAVTKNDEVMGKHNWKA